MKEQIKKYLPWTIRIFIFLLFMVSAVAKLFPIWPFEKQLVDLGISSWCYAPYFSRILISIELALGIAIIQPHFLKKIVIPANILLLVVFCIHLLIDMYKNGGLTGNCGCFGQLIPMTPLEAFIKNIVLIGLLIYLYKNVADKEKGGNKFSILIIIFLASSLFLFLFFPFCPCNKTTPVIENNEIINTTNAEIINTDTIVNNDSVTIKQEAFIKKDELKKDTNPVKQIEKGTSIKKSRFSEFTSFGNKTVNLDEGKKIICFFAPGCDHCLETAKQLVMLSKTINLPEVFIFFMNEEADKIPDFLKESNCNFPFRILEIPKFWQMLGGNANTPGVIFIWDGNEIKFYEGINDNKFDMEDLKLKLQ